METAHFSRLLVEKMQAIVGEAYVLADPENLYTYSHDETEDLSFLPDVVVKPVTPQEVSRIMQFCNEYKIPVTARGAGTGLSGAALPVHKGILLSMERFNKIIHIDEINHQATVEPGVVTQVLQEAVMEKGLFYPVDPEDLGL
jgi:glycolate oxidase